MLEGSIEKEKFSVFRNTIIRKSSIEIEVRSTIVETYNFRVSKFFPFLNPVLNLVNKVVGVNVETKGSFYLCHPECSDKDPEFGPKSKLKQNALMIHGFNPQLSMFFILSLAKMFIKLNNSSPSWLAVLVFAKYSLDLILQITRDACIFLESRNSSQNLHTVIPNYVPPLSETKMFRFSIGSNREIDARNFLRCDVRCPASVSFLQTLFWNSQLALPIWHL